MIYLLHFKSPFKHAKHYLGFVEHESRLDARMQKHAGGRGSKLMAAVSKAGIDFEIARVWQDGDRNFERELKNQKNTPRLCPICNPNALSNFSANQTKGNENVASSSSQPIGEVEQGNQSGQSDAS